MSANRYYEYTLKVDGKTNHDDWTADYPAINSLRRKLESQGRTVKVISREVVVREGEGQTEPFYDLDKLVENLTPVLSKMGLINEANFKTREELRVEVERIIFALMPVFADSLAMTFYRVAHDMYATDEKSSPALVENYSRKQEQMESYASLIRNYGGVDGWSKAAGAGYTA